MSRFIPILLFLIFFGSYCSSAQTTDDDTFTIIDQEPEVEVEPVDPLDVYRNREATNLSKHNSGGSNSITLLSSSKPEVETKQNSDITLTIPAGAQTPISCNITEKDILVGQELLSHINNLASSKNISSYKIHKYKTELAGDIIHMNYIFDSYDKENKFGNYKLSILHKPGLGAVICVHDEAGYYNTFRKVVDSLARSEFLKKKFSQFGTYKTKKIFLVHLNGKSIGYFEAYTFYESSDLLLNITNSVETVPVNETKFVVRERKNIAYVSSVSGELLNQQSTGFENGKPNDSLTITKLDKGKYKVKGTSNKKAVQAELYTEFPVIDSETALTRIIRNYKKGIREKVIYSEFLSPYPTRFSKSELFLISENKGRYKLNYKSSFGMNMYLEADLTGTLKISMLVNNIEIEINRVFYKKKK